MLSGQDSLLADAVEERLRELYAIEQIHKRLKSGDTLFEEARDRFEEAEDRFGKALSAAYNRLYFPSNDPVDGRDVLAGVTIDQGLKLGQGDQTAETQLKDCWPARAPITSSWHSCARTTSTNASRRPRSTCGRLARTTVAPLGRMSLRAPNARLSGRGCRVPVAWIRSKTEALKQGRWRLGEDGYIEKGPFPRTRLP